MTHAALTIYSHSSGRKESKKRAREETTGSHMRMGCEEKEGEKSQNGGEVKDSRGRRVREAAEWMKQC
jgi:hypothetical protein